MVGAARVSLIGTGLVALVMAIGLATRQPWATALWPWPESRLSFIFIASIAAAIGAPVLWIGATGELGAARAGALNLTVTFGGAAATLGLLAARRPATNLLVATLVSAAGMLLCAGIWWWSGRVPLRDRRPPPGPVRASFVLFAALLVPVGGALLARAPHIFPWPLHPDSSRLFGWVFLGAACYFAHGALRPAWANAAGQLLGFLAYDLVLIGPFLGHFATVKPEHRASLIVYVAVLVYSGALAVWYLLLAPATRRRLAAWRRGG